MRCRQCTCAHTAGVVRLSSRIHSTTTAVQQTPIPPPHQLTRRVSVSHATRAVRLVCAWGFAALGLERIELQAAVENPASQRVAERAGFTREAVLRSRWATFGGERHDMVCFGLLADGAPPPTVAG
jgi:hypothetical protein